MPVKKGKTPYKWVIMIYACANDKLSEEGMTNFFKELNQLGKEIDKAGKKAKIKILLQAYRDWDKSKKKSYYGKRFEIKGGFLKKGRIPPDVVYTRLYTNMGDPNALSDFIVWCKDNYKAEHYLLLLWGHAAQFGMFTSEIGGPATEFKKPWRFNMFSNGNKIQYINDPNPVNKTIEKQYRDSQQVKIEFKKRNNKGLADTDIIERKVINNGTSRIKPNKKVLPPTVIYYFDVEKNNRAERLKQLIPEKPTGDALTIEEICKSLWDTGHYIKGTGQIEILMIFGCGMQTFELAYELSKCGSLGCNYLIASEELIYWEGYDYKNSFTKLLNDPGMSAKKLGEHIIIDTENKTPRKNNRGDGHRDKPAWAVSCVDVQKCGKGVNYLNNISSQIIKLSEILKKDFGKRGKKESKWLFEFLFTARLHCRHFGENSFDECYIDIKWFFKSLKEVLKRYEFFDEISRWKNAGISANYKKLISTLDSAISFFGREKGNFVVMDFIGRNRSEIAIWPAKILNRKMEGNKINTSTGAHGSAIFFPMSERVNHGNTRGSEKIFFVSKTDYNLEFQLNKPIKKGWHTLVEKYLNKNLRTRSLGINSKSRFVSKDKSTEPSEWI